ncbi:MAG: hypothetical protein Fur006_38430 [Coleofasciculaceae cyanobacterium]
MKILQIKLPEDKINNFCKRWKILELALFGSVLREDFRSDSDIDVLVTFFPESRFDLLELMAMKEELEDIFGRKVDLVNKRDIERSDNWIRRENILGTARVFYTAGEKLTTEFVENEWPLHYIKNMRDRSSLLDIVKFASNIVEITREMDRAQFESDLIKQSAVLYQISILGEAVKRLSQTFRSQYSEIPWKKIAGMRDKITHQYDRVDLDIVWDVVQNNIPELIATLEPLLSTPEE